MPVADVLSPVPTRTRVHISARRPGASVGYFDQVIAGEEPGMEFRFANGPLAGFDVDVIHSLSDDVEQLAGPMNATATVRAKNALSLVAHLRRHRIALVQTIAETPARPNIVRRILNTATVAWIAPDATIRSPRPERTTIIPFAHYRDRYIGYPQDEMVPGRLLCMSAPDRSELARQLTGVARVSRTVDLSLRIVGEGAAHLESAVQHESRLTRGRVSASAGRISDGALLLEIDQAELIVQPRVERFDDYQAILLALSRNRPVLVPPEESMRALAQEVGGRWVHIARGPVTAAVIDGVLATLRATSPGAAPELTARDPRTVAAAYAAVYRSARSSLQ